MAASMMAAAAVGGGVSTAGSMLERAIFGSGKIKGKSATDRRIREQYQTMVKDLRLAGLNPALAYSSAHPTASATGTALTGKLGSDIAGGMRAGTDAYRAYKKVGPEERLLNAQREGTEAGTAKTRAETVMIEKGLPGANIVERFMSQIDELVKGYMDKGISPEGAHNKVLDLFQDKPTNGQFRQREKQLPTWQPIKQGAKKK